MKYLIPISIFLVVGVSHAEQKMNLDDVSIKGELHSDDRLRMIARGQNQLRNFVKFRTNFRAEMIEGLMRPEPVYLERPMNR
jgi:hypothetical protein